MSITESVKEFYNIFETFLRNKTECIKYTYSQFTLYQLDKAKFIKKETPNYIEYKTYPLKTIITLRFYIKPKSAILIQPISRREYKGYLFYYPDEKNLIFAIPNYSVPYFNSSKMFRELIKYVKNEFGIEVFIVTIKNSIACFESARNKYDKFYKLYKPKVNTYQHLTSSTITKTNKQTYLTTDRLNLKGNKPTQHKMKTNKNNFEVICGFLV